MSIKERIENHPAVWLFATLLSGFLAGVGAYKAVIEMANLKVVPQSQDTELLKKEIDDLKLENGELRSSKAELAAALATKEQSQNGEEEIFLAFGEKAKHLIVVITGEDFEGSGVIVDAAEGAVHVITARHVLLRRGKLQEKVGIRFYQDRGKSFRFEDLRMSRTSDLAAFKVSLLSEPDLYSAIVDTLESTSVADPANLRFGMNVAMVGHAPATWWRLSMPGNIKFYRLEDGVNDPLSSIMIDGFCPAGHEGGGVFDGQWGLVGMIVDNQVPFCRAYSISDISRETKSWGLRVGS